MGLAACQERSDARPSLPPVRRVSPRPRAMTNPDEVVSDLRSRLSRLDPAARFRGFSEDEIAQAERRIGHRLPPLLRHFMLHMGDHAGGLLKGSDWAAPEELPEFREEAEALLAASATKCHLPPAAVVFVFHQGYSFAYLEADRESGPVFEYVEGESQPRQAHASLAEFFEHELRLMESAGLMERPGTPVDEDA